jgi:CheY-like chemotaxis protein
VKEVLKTPSLLSRPIQALMLDFQMPIKTGIQAVQEVKKLFSQINEGKKYDSDLLQEPSYIFLSGHVANEGFKNHCRSLGVEYFFEKPVSPQKLSEMLSILRN